ncbi:hypothetical protein C1645_829142 [Glomus cerebriforme]|uniref:Uncharacterized protein n=1 Tax=Glomus cerebriforme TaxID=658196 RepID=A0A397SUH4_9GLOM|nr:hypothetical protein C1645_829142 [Glomus cerebriforme]
MNILPSIKQKCNRIKTLKEENSNLIVNNICEKDIESIGKLEDTLKNTYETVEQQNEPLNITISRMEELEHKVNGIKFFSSYRDWLLQEVRAKSNTIFHRNKQSLGEAKMKLHDPIPDNIRIYKPPLQKALEAIAPILILKIFMSFWICWNNQSLKLKNLLSGVGMTLDDIKLLQEVRAKSNTIFHRNKQILGEAKMKLHDPIPDNIRIYKPPLQKALETIEVHIIYPSHHEETIFIQELISPDSRFIVDVVIGLRRLSKEYAARQALRILFTNVLKMNKGKSNKYTYNTSKLHYYRTTMNNDNLMPNVNQTITNSDQSTYPMMNHHIHGHLPDLMVNRCFSSDAHATSSTFV